MKTVHQKAWGQLADKFVNDANNFDESKTGPISGDARFLKRMIGLYILGKEKGVSAKQVTLNFHPDKKGNHNAFILFEPCNDAVLKASNAVSDYRFFLYHMPKDILNSLCKKLEESSESHWFLQRWLANAVPFLFNILRAITNFVVLFCAVAFTPVFSFFRVVIAVFLFDFNTDFKSWLGFPSRNDLTEDEKIAVEEKIVAAYKPWFLECVLACFASEINDQTSNDVKNIINQLTLSDDNEPSRIFNKSYYYKIINEFGYQPYNERIDYKKLCLTVDKIDINTWQTDLEDFKNMIEVEESIGEATLNQQLEIQKLKHGLKQLTKMELDSIGFWVVLKYQLTGEEGESLLRKSIMSQLRLIRNLTFIAFDISNKILGCAINAAIYVINSALYFAESVLYVGIYLLNPFKVLQDACKISTLYIAFAALIVTSAAALGVYYCSIVALMNVMIMGQICTVSFFGLLGSYELSCLYTTYTDDPVNKPLTDLFCLPANSLDDMRANLAKFRSDERPSTLVKDASEEHGWPTGVTKEHKKAYFELD